MDIHAHLVEGHAHHVEDHVHLVEDHVHLVEDHLAVEDHLIVVEHLIVEDDDHTRDQSVGQVVQVAKVALSLVAGNYFYACF